MQIHGTEYITLNFFCSHSFAVPPERPKIRKKIKNNNNKKRPGRCNLNCSNQKTAFKSKNIKSNDRNGRGKLYDA